MKLSNEALSKAAEIKAENFGRIFFKVGDHVLSYWFGNDGKHYVAHTMRFWKSGVVDSVGGKDIFNTESDTINFIKQKAEFYKMNPISK